MDTVSDRTGSKVGVHRHSAHGGMAPRRVLDLCAMANGSVLPPQRRRGQLAASSSRLPLVFRLSKPFLPLSQAVAVGCASLFRPCCTIGSLSLPAGRQCT